MSLKYVVRAGDLVKYGWFSFHWRSNAEHHVVGIEVARRLEVLGGLPLHALAQVEGVGQAVGRDGPLLGQGRHDLGAAALELDDAAVSRPHCGRGSCRLTFICLQEMDQVASNIALPS